LQGLKSKFFLTGTIAGTKTLFKPKIKQDQQIVKEKKNLPDSYHITLQTLTQKLSNFLSLTVTAANNLLSSVVLIFCFDLLSSIALLYLFVISDFHFCYVISFYRFTLKSCSALISLI
jgi:hypothetical protein